MRPLSNSVYSSVFMYNPNVLMRRYRQLTNKGLIEPHHITCVSLDISVLIVRFGDQARACRVGTPTSHQNELSTLQQKFLGYLTNCLIKKRQTVDYTCSS